MGFFKRKESSSTGVDRRTGDGGPMEDLAAKAERAAQNALDLTGNTDFGIWNEVFAPLLEVARADPAGFCNRVAAECLNVPGYAQYGAEQLVCELVGMPDERPATPAATQVLDAAITFLRANFVPPMRVPNYMWTRFIDQGGTSNTWLELKQPPPRDSAHITPLESGETRKLLRMDPRETSNWVLARADGENYVALIDRRYSDEDPTRSQDEWKREASLYDLYLAVAWESQVWDWADPELVPFFPAPKALV